jgi:hypothetical protein
MATEKINLKNKPAVDSKSHSTNNSQNTQTKESKQGFKNKLTKAGYSTKVADNIWNLYN